MTQINKPTLIFYIDEAGRWPLAGPMAVGVILPLKKIKKADLEVFRDSKKLSESKREALFGKIEEMVSQNLLSFWVWWVSEKEIDKLGMTKAQALAIERGIDCFASSQWQTVKLIIDWNRDFWLRKLHPEWEIETIVKGDDKVKEISMASIVAKVSRDRLMYELSHKKKYQKYWFEKHKWYGTKSHIEAIKKFWPSDIHRRLFLRKLSLR